MSDFKTCVERYLKEKHTEFTMEELCYVTREFSRITLAHYMAADGHIFPLDSALLSNRDSLGNSVAYLMALRGFVFPEDHEALYYSNNVGDTVAHAMSKLGNAFSGNHPAWKLTNKKKESVVDVFDALTEDIIVEEIIDVVEKEDDYEIA